MHKDKTHRSKVHLVCQTQGLFVSDPLIEKRYPQNGVDLSEHPYRVHDCPRRRPRCGPLVACPRTSSTPCFLNVANEWSRNGPAEVAFLGAYVAWQSKLKFWRCPPLNHSP